MMIQSPEREAVPRRMLDNKPSGVVRLERRVSGLCPQDGQVSKYSPGFRASLRGATVFDQPQAGQA
jgi:hypothetical protein